MSYLGGRELLFRRDLLRFSATHPRREPGYPAGKV
jgi:hypothetical protein